MVLHYTMGYIPNLVKQFGKTLDLLYVVCRHYTLVSVNSVNEHTNICGFGSFYFGFILLMQMNFFPILVTAFCVYYANRFPTIIENIFFETQCFTVPIVLQYFNDWSNSRKDKGQTEIQADFLLL